MIAYVSIPALVALIFKFVLMGYTVRSPVKNTVTRLLLVLLVVFTLLNFDEFFFLNYVPKYGITPLVQQAGFFYVGLWGVIVPILMHLSLALSVGDAALSNRWLVFGLYAPVVPIEFLLFFTDKLVLYFRPFLYSILRVPGPWYWIAESFAISYLGATLLLLIYGARGSRPALLRIRNRVWLLGLGPMILLVVYMILAYHLNWHKLTFPIHIPLAVTFFLLVTTYATHERHRPGGFYRFLYRLFDIESFLPWSRTYRRKTVLYEKIRGMISDATDLCTIKDIIDRVSHTLHCPVALLSRQQSPVSAGDATRIARFPRDELRGIDRFVVVHQIGNVQPRTHLLMKQYSVAAIVPFHPYSRAASWMLLGDAFNEQVYTPADFDVVKKLFDRLADRLLDEQLNMQAQVYEAEEDEATLNQDSAGASQKLDTATKQTDSVEARNRQKSCDDLTLFTKSATGVQPGKVTDIATNDKTLAAYVADLERRMIVNALERCGGNQAKAAGLLGLRPNTLHYKIQRYGLAEYKKEP